MCKLVERMIKRRANYLLEDDTTEVVKLSTAQAGFRTGRDTTEQIALLTQTLKDNNDDNKFSISIFLDFEKAFDTVNKARLMERLRKMKLPPRYVKWISSFLKERKAAVNVDGTTGEYFTKEEGTPQGTVLSPLLFLCFIDDLAKKLEEHEIDTEHVRSLFDDDVAVVVSGKDAEEARQRAEKVLHLIEEWTEEWDLRLSKKKTCYMVTAKQIPRQKPVLMYKDGSTHVAYDKNPVFLGVKCDEKMSFKAHVEYVLERMNKWVLVLRTLGGTKWGCSVSALRTVYLTYVLPVATYAQGVYGPTVKPPQARAARRHG
eukprot:TRINITY_DN13576_c0_g3_i6.p1 TRINITY_DN13576_c0_g3~~TRINITY_DN13576_c0_g3_i6.p1  ORF type:complete len:346 (+),score=68.40 TRINITY_DN13576_c0_g3_i6:93-1040(+)